MAKQYRTNKLKRFLRAATCCALACVTVFGLTSCKPTDFFTEVIISPFAETVDVNNPDKLVVNSPDSDQESTELASLDWTDNATKSEEVQTLITYNENPTSDMTAHHSIFSLTPRFHGIVSSDPVQLDFTDDTDLEEEGNPEPSDTDYSAQQSLLEGLQALMEGAQSTNGPSDTGTQKTDNTANGEGEGEGGDPYAGYDGDIDIYDSGSGLAKINKVDHAAATGQAAILVQALAGEGALCAMDEATYYGSGDTLATFSEVFGDELTDGFESNCLLWKSDGTIDMDALIDACGEGGLIIFEGSKDDVYQAFDEEQRKRLQAASIQVAPVDFSTVDGIIDAATAIGKAFSESKPAASNMANQYIERINYLVDLTATSADDGGGLAARDEGAGLRQLTDYEQNPVKGQYSINHVYTAIGTEYIRGITYTGYGSFTLSTSQGVLFSRLNEKSTPLSFWAQAAGVWNSAANNEYTKSNSYAVIWGIASGAIPGENGKYLTGAQILSKCTEQITLSSEETTTSSTAGYFGDGLGSASFPYLIVPDSEGHWIKNSVVGQMNSTSSLNPYSVLNWVGNGPQSGPSYTDSNGNTSWSTIGSTDQGKSAFLDLGVEEEETVRENPRGLLGSWTDGSVECVLESVWLARIYSAAPTNSNYEPVRNLSKEKLKEVIVNFYNDFYFHDDSSAQDWYDKVVTDEGL